jgi:lipid II:glycine glycyltransferase (peptidoglycan interpeptide bridge formation enzyme)
MSPKWVDALVKEGNEAVYLNFDDNGTVVAKIAGIVVRGGLLKGRQLYFYAAPALSNINEELFHQCMEALLRFAKKSGFVRVSVRPWDQQHSFKTHAKGFRPTVTHEYEVDLSREYVDSTISSRILRNVKKGRKTGVQIRESSSIDDLKLLLSFLESTKNRRVSKFGNNYSPFYINLLGETSIANMLENGMAKFYCAELDGQTQSIMLMLESGDRTYNLLKGSVDEAYTSGASSFIDFEVIRIYQQKGFKVLNLGVELLAGDGDGLNMYKEGIGGKRIKKLGAYTYYLYFPYSVLNVLFMVSHMVPDVKWILWLKRKLSALFSGAKN